MKKFTGKTPTMETAASAPVLLSDFGTGEYPAYVGLDVHKETIAVAVARAGRGAPESWGEIANRPKRVARELVGFIWDIACREMPKVAPQAAR